MLFCSRKKSIKFSFKFQISFAALYLKPEIMFNNELFPAPEGPRIAQSLPEVNFPDSPFRISTLPPKKIHSDK